MKYVALLRGINVGGKAKISMSKLKNVFESLDLNEVKTYINSGNVMFTTTKSAAKLDALLEEAIEKEFGFHVPVVICSFKTLQAIIKKIPISHLNNTEQKTDVLFLWDSVNEKKVLQELTIKPGIDNVQYVDGAILWNVKRADITRSGLLKIVGTDFYKKTTIRNVNTVRKLHAMMEDASKTA